MQIIVVHSKVINSHGATLLTNLDATFKHVRK